MEKKNENATILIYIVERYGQIIGCYDNQQDAVQIQSVMIAKGQICNLIVKPLQKSFANG